MKDGGFYLDNYDGSKERQAGSKEKLNFQTPKCEFYKRIS